MFKSELEKLKQNLLLRTIKDRASRQGARIIIEGKEYLNFASNDYLGLCHHPEIISAAEDALKEFGTGAGASRLLSGGTILHRELESKIALFKGTEAALVFNSGYAANTGIIPAIASEQDAVFSDELNHASIIDGIRLSRAKTYIYRHKDMEHLHTLLKDCRAEKKIVITDTVFSMDGDTVPLNDIYNLCKEHGALLYIDDAHGTGVLGKGKGALEHFGIKPEPWIIQMGTMSKALGSFGAFAAADKDTINWLLNSARSFMFSTALPAHVAAASLASLDVLKKETWRIDRLWQNRNKLMNALKGFNTGSTETPIIPIIMKDIEGTLKLSEQLYEKGIYAPAIRPPTVKEPRIRITVTAEHSEEDIERLTEAIQKANIPL